MKNRFYDAKMHGADWNGAWETYGALLDNLVDEEELHTVMMMMIGQLNASHTGVSGGPPPSSGRSRHAIRDSISSPTRRDSTRSATSTRTARPIATT